MTWSCLLTSPDLSRRVDNSAESGMSGMDKFGNVIDRMNIKLGSKFPNFLRIKTQLLKRLQRLIVVDGATYSQKNGVEGNRGSL
jgi:hypothetical protein